MKVLLMLLLLFSTEIRGMAVIAMHRIWFSHGVLTLPVPLHYAPVWIYLQPVPGDPA